MTDYGAGAWSRVAHAISLAPATLKNGSQALIATWEATAEYSWGYGYYRRHPPQQCPTSRAATCGSTATARSCALPTSSAASSTPPAASARTSSFPFDETGTYEVILSSSNSRKDGGYWPDAQNLEGSAPHNCWTEVDLEKSRASITI